MPHRTVLRCALAAAVLLLLPGAAGAQLFRAYLDSAGLDTNACTLAAPCRLLPAALAAVADGGEIWMLDSGVRAASLAPTAVRVSVRDSRVTRNALFGLMAGSDDGGTAVLLASNNIVSNNGFYGIVANVGGAVWASGNTVSGHAAQGLSNTGGLFETAGNNAVRNNATDTSGTITAIPTM